MCVFCDIIKGTIPSSKIYEDEKVIAFLDLAQVTKGHTLVVPKKHYDHFIDCDSETLAYLMQTAQKLAAHIVQVTGAAGMNILSNVNEVKASSIFTSISSRAIRTQTPLPSNFMNQRRRISPLWQSNYNTANSARRHAVSLVKLPLPDKGRNAERVNEESANALCSSQSLLFFCMKKPMASDFLFPIGHCLSSLSVIRLFLRRLIVDLFDAIAAVSFGLQIVFQLLDLLFLALFFIDGD